MKHFTRQLKNYVLTRLSSNKYTGKKHDYSCQDRNQIVILNNRLYRHKVLRINYTTYDLRRAQDSINPSTHGESDIMVLSHEDDRCWHFSHYGTKSGVQITNSRENSLSLYALVRPSRKSIWWMEGTLALRDGLSQPFAPFAGAFGFLDPALVIRSIHLLPCFRLGCTKTLLGLSFVRPASDNDEVWDFYCIGMFVDRDMLMRFRGGGVGHNSTRAATDTFKSDQDALDIKRSRVVTLSGLEHNSNPEGEIDEEDADESQNDDEDEEQGEDGDENGSGSESDEDEGLEDEMDEFGYLDNADGTDAGRDTINDDEEEERDGEMDQLEQLGFSAF